MTNDQSIKNKILQVSYKDSKDAQINRESAVKGILRKLRGSVPEPVAEGEQLISENSVSEILSPEDADEREKARLKRV